MQVGKKEYPISSQKRKYSRKLNFVAMTSAERDNPDLQWKRRVPSEQDCNLVSFQLMKEKILSNFFF